MAPTFAYWDSRGLGQVTRNLLVYKGVPFQDKRYKKGPPPEYSRDEWLADKFSLGLKFPNLPYYIDGDVKLTQSVAILRYLARKYDLGPRNEEETRELDVLEQQARDLATNLIRSFLPGVNLQEARKKYEENMGNVLKPWADHLANRKWAVGDRVTYVDFLVYEALDWNHEFCAAAFKDFPALEQYLKRFEALPNIKEYFASDKYKKWPITAPHFLWGFKK
ncbi:glutathione S-transferase Mu 4 [Ixodes scapularis]|uniref:glutathione S-transferase Mu 4 n=1 Tax=Ixodes scapularis TaxID=6945 RepID=UPI001A9F9A9E|nr:glutathione S-transferase Mu 4 [Ixodes scapularis]